MTAITIASVTELEQLSRTGIANGVRSAGLSPEFIQALCAGYLRQGQMLSWLSTYEPELVGKAEEKFAIPSETMSSETDDQENSSERKILADEAADNLRLIDRIADEIGLPTDDELSLAAVVAALQSARLQGREEGMEEAAKWHDAEAERIRLLALEPTAESVYRMHEAQDDHLSHAAFIRELAKVGA